MLMSSGRLYSEGLILFRIFGVFQHSTGTEIYFVSGLGSEALKRNKGFIQRATELGLNTVVVFEFNFLQCFVTLCLRRNDDK